MSLKRKPRLGAGLAVAGAPAAFCMADTLTGLIITVLGAVLSAAVIITALYASDKLSGRAFRLLPWVEPRDNTQPSRKAETSGHNREAPL